MEHDFFSSGYDASSIIIEDDNYKIFIIPQKFYKINVKDYSRSMDNIYVIMYTFVQIKKGSTSVISAMLIPYYLSAGHTNYFRANLLLPFISFNLKRKDKLPEYRRELRDAGKEIPPKLIGDTYDDKIHLIANEGATYEGMGLLFKNVLVKNTNLSNKNSEILDMFNKIDTNPFLPDIREAISTVIPRMENLLDFIIAIQSKKLNEEYINPSGGIYRPWDSMSPLSSFDYTNINIDDGLDKYRELIAEFLHNTNRIIKTNKIIKIKNIKLPLECMDMIDFNNEYGVCLNDPTKKNRHKPKRVNDFKNYIIISKNFFTMFKNKITTSVIIPEEDKKELMSILMNETTEIPSEITLNQNILLWNASCQKKYLKYKRKYLKLKNKINQ
jgi:hypothetical protein